MGAFINPKINKTIYKMGQNIRGIPWVLDLLITKRKVCAKIIKNVYNSYRGNIYLYKIKFNKRNSKCFQAIRTFVGLKSGLRLDKYCSRWFPLADKLVLILCNF